jgi:choline dehydrogenase
VTGALAERVTFDDRRATGVAYRAGGERRIAGARREVMLACGAINAPQLLMLSGIGPAEHLRTHGIEVVADLPGVGQNLQDHPVTGLWMATERPVTLFAAETPRQLGAYLLRRRGLLSSNVAEAAAFVRTRRDVSAPDVEIVFCPVLFEREGLVPPSGHGFTFGIVALKPQSRWVVALRSRDPEAAPVICPRYLSDPADLSVLLAGLRLARRIVAQPALAPWAGEELEPGPAVRDDDGLIARVRANAHGIYHPVGTC